MSIENKKSNIKYQKFCFGIFTSVFLIFGFLSFILVAPTAYAQVSAEVPGLILQAPDIRVVIANIIRIALGFLGIITVGLILYGGFLWMTAGGNEETIEKAKKVLTNSVIGLVIILTSFAITQFLIGKFTEATRGPSEVSISNVGGGYIGLAPGSFVVRGISPKGESRIRNIVVRVVLSRAPAGDAQNLLQNIIVARKDTGAAVSGVRSVSGTTIEFRPDTACPSPNQTRKCFDENTEFTVEAKPGLLSSEGRNLICGGLAPTCTGQFKSGSVVDTQPPQVTLTSPDPGAQVPGDSCVPLQAHVTDDAGISSVEFYADGNLIVPDGTVTPAGEMMPTATDVSIPCWNTTGIAVPSAHILKAKAHDVDDNQTTSRDVRVMVRPLYCFNNTQDTNLGETGFNCGGQCGACDDAPCTATAECAGGACVNGRCATPTTITGVSPADGGEGTIVGIVGYNFGVTRGIVNFYNDKPATQVCAGADTWKMQQVLVGVPAGAETGPITIVKAGCAAGDSLCRDSTNDERGPLVPTRGQATSGSGQATTTTTPLGSFEVNNVAHPGLCVLASPPQNQAQGGWTTTVQASGVRFGVQPGTVSFGGVSGLGIAGWTDTGAQSAVPPPYYGPIQVQIVNAQGVPSNSIPYDVLSPDAGTLPIIDAISCAPTGNAQGGVGTGCTISGRNFGDTVGVVWFIAPDGQAVQADTAVPPSCALAWWSPESITVKVPEVLDRNDMDNDRNVTERLTSVLADNQKYKVYVHRYDAQDSNRKEDKDFEMLNEPAGPFLACILPASGPVLTNTTLYGERLGAIVAPARGVRFTRSDSVVRTAAESNWLSTLANLSRVGGAASDSCPVSGWSATQVCAQVPINAITGMPPGQVIVENEINGTTAQSNPVEFRVGNCHPSTDVAAISCGTLTCCDDGTCNSQCTAAPALTSAYGWQFSTAPAPVVPEVKIFCDTAAGDGHPTAPPSPAPWDRRMGNDVCVNAAVSVDFTTRIDNTLNSLRTSGLKVDKCTASENLLTPADSTFGTQGPAWMPVASEYIAYGRVQGRGRPKPVAAVGQTDPDPGNYALVLAKLDDDTGPDWENAQGIAQNYEHWFGYQANVLSSTNGGSFTASAWLKAATASAVGKQAGILIQRDNSTIGAGSTEAGFWMKRSQEITLTNEWQQATAEITFDRNGPNSAAPGFVRLFVEGLPHDVRDPEPEPDQQELFSVYADDIVVTGDPCRTTQTVSLDDPAQLEIIATGPQSESLRWEPASAWDTNSWYRVTLLGGPNGILGEVPASAPTGTTGMPMEILQDTTACGYVNAAYCFKFKTRDSTAPCEVGGVAVSPNPWTATAADPDPAAKINYSAMPVAAEDRCVPLRRGSQWSWNSSDWIRASVSLPPNTGHACSNSTQCEVGDCTQGFCRNMPWTTTATSLAETLVNQPVRIIATTNQIPGSADLDIHFEDPKVVRYWPNCEEACTNAGIGAEFNVAMDSQTLENADVALWKIPCGNGTVEIGEDCDDGNVIPGDGCSARCILEGSNFNYQCGDGGALDPGEDCDDNNTVSGDGCSASCLHEGTTTTCGNGTVNAGEDCDDGNTNPNDGCSSTCLHEGITSRSSVCGNGKLELGEECERTGLSISGTPVFATWCAPTNCLRKGQDAPFCGNGRVDPGEECDRVGGAWPPNNLCGTVLDVGGTSTRCLWTGTQKPQRLGGGGCGNGRIEVGEDCDDGNVTPGDGCSGTCLNEGSISSTLPSCGNGIVNPGEDCDDSNVNSGDGCSAQCLNEGTPTATCGNSRIDPGEGCDRGLISAALCTVDCKNAGTDSVACAVSVPPAGCTTNPNTCGNGRKDDGEGCDDGNTDDGNTAVGDGCSAQCLNAGSDPARVSSAVANYNAQTKTLTFGALELLPKTFYRVLLRGDNQGIRSQVGKALNAAQPTELNFYYNWSVVDNPATPQQEDAPLPSLVFGTTPNTYTWTFRTRDSACAVHRVDLNPPEASLYVVGARQRFSATPFGAPDSCDPSGQQLQAETLTWSWNTNDPVVATIVDSEHPAQAPFGVDIIPSCGNGRLERGEDCDDGNTISGDGCFATCLNEGSLYSIKCGDQIPGPGEECDPPSIGCSSRCLKLGSLPCAPGQTLGCCGNTTVDTFEDCDGGNSVPGDGCSARCLNEGSSAENGQCGDGVVNVGEECDPSDPVLTQTLTVGGRKITGAPSNRYFCNPSTCLLKGTGSARCGNGAIEPGEDCDDGNVVSGDGCAGLGADKPCTNEGSSATRRTFCGNSRLERGEDCDDGNAVSNDGCSANCLNEGTIAENPARIDPYQQAVAMGVRESERARGWSIADVLATSGKTGNAPLTVYCVARTDRDCPIPVPAGSIGTGSAVWGRGVDNCCYSRPQVLERNPEGIESCPNAMLRAVFSTLLDPESLAGNVRLVKVPATGTECPAGEKRIDPITGNPVVAIPPATTAPPTSPLWCSPNETTLAPALESATNGATPGSALILRPSRMLETTTHYRVLLYGDRNLNDDVAQGIKSSRGVAMSGLDSAWDFTTGATVCTLDEVRITVNPNYTHFTRSDETREVQARAISRRGDQEIQPFAGSYVWTWSWGTEDGDIATVTSNVDNGGIKNDQTVTAGTKNGTATINATARITVDTVLTPSSVNRTVVGTQQFTTLLCDNPWPINPATGQFKRYEDSDGPDAVKPGTTPMNFATYYCRDGQSVLPALQYPGAVRVAPDSERPLLKEFLLVGTGFNATGEVEQKDGDIFTRAVRISGGEDIEGRSGTVQSDTPARIEYSFNILDDGDYELEVETSNWENTNKHDADLSNLARVLEEEEVPESTRRKLERSGARLTGAVYHQLGVYLGASDGTPDGMISNIASGPAANHPRGSAILRGVRRGTQTITLEWLNDESLSPIWDSNLRIYKVVLRKGKSRDDAIGIRVMENPQRLDVRAWYRARGFTGKPEAFPAVDGYEAIKDGNTVYIGAINAVPPDPAEPQVFRKVYGNIYLITLSESAGASTRAIYDQLIKNLTFNLNVENLKTCTNQFCSNDETKACAPANAASACGAPDAVCIQKVCSNDLECKIDGSDTCRSDKDKLRRDLARVNQLNSMQQSLEAYKARVGRYPTLESGTFIRSLTNSRWPSWQGALGAELGAPAPLDPINRFAQGCQTQSTERGTFDEATCWNEVLQTYRCPRGSHVYQYQSLGGLEYTLKAEFERLELSSGESRWDIANWPPATIRTDGMCNWTTGNRGSTWSATEARCGDRIVQPGAVPPEECEAGDTQTQSIALDLLHCSGLPSETCTVDAGCKFCSNHPATGFSTCNTNADCTDEGVCTQFGRCLPLTSCTASRSCGNTSCQWNPWIGNPSTAGVVDCRPSSRYCGNGVVDPDSVESCDDGPLNGQYGKCKADCSGIGPHCGDPVLNNAAQSNPALRGPEVCDGTNSAGVACVNGEYGCCRFDCTGLGERCGDSRVNGDESCDGGSQQASGLCSTTTTQGCARNGDCPTGETCNLCSLEAVTNYAQARQRSCNVGCGWNAWGDCVVAGARCGNGVREGSEQCDRSDDSDSTDDVNRNGIPDGNEDACNNDCTLARCGDGFDQGKVCTGNAASAGRTCTTDAQCGSGGRCADSEDCDLGGGNGTSCDPRYNGTCTFCDRQCNAVTVSGGFCGDRLWQTSEEQCDGALGLTSTGGALAWVCQGSVGVNEWFWNFTEVPEEFWSRASATLTRVEPGYNSRSAMKIKATAAGREAQFDQVLDTDGKSYIISGWFNTLQAGTRQVQIVMDRVGVDDTWQETTWLTLDNNSSTWQYLEKQVSFDSGIDRDKKGIIRIRVKESGDEILVDQVHLRPAVSATCSGNTCQASCAAGGSVCQNVLKRCELGVRPGAECNTDADCNPTGSGGTCRGQNFDGDLISDACDTDKDNDGYPVGGAGVDCNDQDARANPDMTEICDDNLDSDCDGLGHSADAARPYSSASNLDDECYSANIVVSDLPIVSGRTTPDADRFEVFLNEQRKGIVDNTAPERRVTISRLHPGDYTLRIVLTNANSGGDNNFYVTLGGAVTLSSQSGAYSTSTRVGTIRGAARGSELILNLRIGAN